MSQTVNDIVADTRMNAKQVGDLKVVEAKANNSKPKQQRI